MTWDALKAAVTVMPVASPSLRVLSQVMTATSRVPPASSRMISSLTAPLRMSAICPQSWLRADSASPSPQAISTEEALIRATASPPVSKPSVWRLSAVTSVGLYHDWRERLRPRGSEVSETTAYVSVRLDPTWKLQLYGVKGFSDASPDYGAGLMVSRIY